MRRTLDTTVPSLRSAALALLLGLAACSSDNGLSHYAEALSKSVEGLILGAESTPSEHLDELAAVHEPDTWTLRRDVDDALPRARAALRALAGASYAGRDDATRVVEIVSQIGTEHDYALMRVEAIDTLAEMSTWTPADTPRDGTTSSDEQMIEALKVLKAVTDAAGASDATGAAGATADDVAGAVTTIAAYDFERVEPVRATAPLLRARRGYRERLRNARGVLKGLTTSALDPYRADPRVRPALDDALGRLARAVIGLTLDEVVLGDDADIARSAAALRLADVRPRTGADALSRVVRQDARSSVRRDAATALAAFAPIDSVPALLDALADSVGDVRDASLRSLRGLTGEDLGADRAAWRAYWDTVAPAPEEPAGPASTTAR